MVVAISMAFGAATVFATRFYRSKQQQLGAMWFSRGQAVLIAGESQAAVQDFRNALYYSHDDAAYRLRLAEALAAANHIPEAQSYLVALWQEEPSNSTVNLQLARLTAKQGETQAALRYYHGAIYGLWPDGNAQARRRQTRRELIHYLLGLHEATQADAELVALSPELPRTAAAHAEVGELFLKAGDPEHASEEYEEALGRDPKFPAALRGAGEAEFQLGRYQNARHYLELAQRVGPLDQKAAELLATSRLIMEWNPYARGISSRQKARRIAQAFRRARQRLNECASKRAIDLTAEPAETLPPIAAGSPRTVTRPAGANDSASLVARIFGKIRPGENAGLRPGPGTGNVKPGEMQRLFQQVLQAQTSMRTRKLEHDPQLADLAMGLAAQIEMVTAEQCGTPGGADLALLLLSHPAEEQ